MALKLRRNQSDFEDFYPAPVRLQKSKQSGGSRRVSSHGERPFYKNPRIVGAAAVVALLAIERPGGSGSGSASNPKLESIYSSAELPKTAVAADGSLVPDWNTRYDRVARYTIAVSSKDAADTQGSKPQPTLIKNDSYNGQVGYGIPVSIDFPDQSKFNNVFHSSDPSKITPGIYAAWLMSTKKPDLAAACSQDLGRLVDEAKQHSSALAAGHPDAIKALASADNAYTIAADKNDKANPDAYLYYIGPVYGQDNKPQVDAQGNVTYGRINLACTQ